MLNEKDTELPISYRESELGRVYEALEEENNQLENQITGLYQLIAETEKNRLNEFDINMDIYEDNLTAVENLIHERNQLNEIAGEAMRNFQATRINLIEVTEMYNQLHERSLKLQKEGEYLRDYFDKTREELRKIHKDRMHKKERRRNHRLPFTIDTSSNTLRKKNSRIKVRGNQTLSSGLGKRSGRSS